jgi:hypothetical protein
MIAKTFFVRPIDQQARTQVLRTELFNASERSSNDSALSVNSANPMRLTGM